VASDHRAACHRRQETQVGSGESILITQSLDDCIPLHFFLAAVLPTFAEPVPPGCVSNSRSSWAASRAHPRSRHPASRLHAGNCWCASPPTIASSCSSSICSL